MWLFSLFLAATAFASSNLPEHQLSAGFIGLAGNSGGEPNYHARFRLAAVEASAYYFKDRSSGSLGLQAAFVRHLNEDGFFVPRVGLGLAVAPNLALVPLVGLEILPRFGGSRVGLRLDHEASVQLSRKFTLGSLTTVGVTWHF